MALKTYEKSKLVNDSYRKESLKKEVEILGKIDHPNIIKLFDSIDTSTKVSIVLEYFQGKSLYQYLRKKSQMKLSESEAKVIFR